MNYLRVRSLVHSVTAVLILLLSQAVFAQHIRGALEGTVNDPNEAAVPGAAVTLRNDATGKEISTTSRR
jgi:hypothetical protein